MGFNQQKLLQYMSSHSILTEKEVEELQSAVAKYPYFQLGYSFIAKGKHDLQAPDADTTLHHAAIYAPSRRQLRKLFYENLQSNNSSENSELATPLPQETGTVSQTTATEAVAEENNTQADIDTTISQAKAEEVKEEASVPLQTPSEVEPASRDSIYKELEENLKKLRNNRQQNLEEQTEENKKKITDKASSLSDFSPSAPVTPSSDNPETPTPQNPPYFIDYLKDIEPIESERLGINQQRQRELIDKFMNSERDVKLRWRYQELEPQDLSEKGSVFSDNLATENLADIYIKQGKKDKAIDILERLQLKYPQKKTYFAEKIESLKEK